jgi:hypothetical protein
MGIGDKVRAAEEAKAEAALNAEGKLSARQLKTLVQEGLAPLEARTLAADGLGYEELLAIATAQRTTQADASDREDITKAIRDGMNQARSMHNPVSPAVSSCNPLGDTDHPRPGLRYEWWLGVINDRTGLAERTGWQLEPDELTVFEQLALNACEPSEGIIQRLDGVEMRVLLASERNDRGEIQRMVLALPANLISKQGENKNMVPPITSIVQQMTGQDFRQERFGTYRKGVFVFHEGQREALIALLEREVVAA